MIRKLVGKISDMPENEIDNPVSLGGKGKKEQWTKITETGTRSEKWKIKEKYNERCIPTECRPEGWNQMDLH